MSGESFIDLYFVDVISWEKLRDNRDIPVSDTWDREVFTLEHKTATFNDQVTMV